jgi:hypothetical protein
VEVRNHEGVMVFLVCPMALGSAACAVDDIGEEGTPHPEPKYLRIVDFLILWQGPKLGASALF